MVEALIMFHLRHLQEVDIPIQQLPKAELVICAMELVKR